MVKDLSFLCAGLPCDTATFWFELSTSLKQRRRKKGKALWVRFSTTRQALYRDVPVVGKRILIILIMANIYIGLSYQTVPSTLHILTHLILTTTLQDNYTVLPIL